MTRKDFEAVAAGIADTMATIRADVDSGNGPAIEPDAVAMMIGDSLADYFATVNPRFDRARFLAAADLNDPIPSEAFHV
jgi:hypothetical protein